MMSKVELLALYTSMVVDGEGDMLHAEISECTRLKELYEERLRCLLERDPKLALVREGAVHLYDHYEAHFRTKVRENEMSVEAATEVLNKWKNPPQRPRGSPPNDDFLMDFENEVLQDWDARKGIPTGPRRFQNPEWAELIQRNVYPHTSDVDWYEYVVWVENGGGDEWFTEE